MSASHNQKAPVGGPQNGPLSGWHPEDVKAAIRKRGTTLTALALENGFSEAYLRHALTRPLFQGEQIIARFLRIKPQIIWPDRYDEDGNPDYRRWRATRDLKRTRRAA